jgi:hypothetical protein
MDCCIDTGKGGSMNELLSTGQLARLIGVPLYKIAYAHLHQDLAEPACRILGKRMYDAEDVRRVAEHFGVTIATLLMADAVEKEAK